MSKIYPTFISCDFDYSCSPSRQALSDRYLVADTMIFGDGKTYINLDDLINFNKLGGMELVDIMDSMSINIIEDERDMKIVLSEMLNKYLKILKIKSAWQYE